MGRAAPLVLHENFRIGHRRLDDAHDRVVGRPDHDGNRSAALAGRRQRMGDQGTPGDHVQHLGARRPHAGTFAGGKHDGEAGGHFA